MPGVYDVVDVTSHVDMDLIYNQLVALGGTTVLRYESMSNAVMKAGTDPGRVKVISDGLAKYAATDDYKAYLKDQYADEKSFVGAAGAAAFMKQELDAMKKYAPKK